MTNSDSGMLESYIEDNLQRDKWFKQKQKRIVKAFLDISSIYKALAKNIGESPRVLDIGTGAGYFVNSERDLGYRAYGIDMIKDFDIKKDDNDNRFLIANAKKLPFMDDSFDLVYENMFFSDILDFQNGKEENFNVYLDEISRVVKPGGFYVGAMEYSWLREKREFTKMAFSSESMGFYRRNESDYTGGVKLNIQNWFNKIRNIRKI